LGLALAVRIREVYGTIEEDEIIELDHRVEAAHEQTDLPRPEPREGRRA
jgi:hypothetical protein